MVRRHERDGNAATPPLRVNAPDDFVPYLLEWTSRTQLSREALSILYAHINVNVVDGSSVWLSSMASVLCSKGPCVLVSKVPIHRDVVLSNVRNAQNLIVIEPTVVPGLQSLDIAAAIRLIRALDALLPEVKALVARGLDPADQLLMDRQFYARLAVYLTDFFSIDDSRRVTSTEQRRKLSSCLTRVGKLLVQTHQIAEEMHALTGQCFEAIHVPPIIPDDVQKVETRPAANGTPIRIGYAGKVNSRWGVLELLDWTERLVSEGLSVELHIVTSKISNGPDSGHNNLREVITSKLAAVGAKHYTSLNRQAAMELMATMDFVWCYRPHVLEENTLELSTKLVEMVAIEARCICYPNRTNKEALGSDYPFFVRSFPELRRLLQQPVWGRVPAATAAKLRERHGLAQVTREVLNGLFPSVAKSKPDRTIVFAGHDFKFLDAYISRLKQQGVPVARDTWDWGTARSQDALLRLRDMADVVFCEWGLANAVWYSKNIKPDQRLLVRIHAQEIRERARRFGAAIDVTRVEKFIFVSHDIRDRALELWDWPAEKTVIVPNYVLEKEFLPAKRTPSSKVVIGMVGIVPRLKRFDRAIELLKLLVAEGVDATLKIKGHRPETLKFMHAPSRRPELEYYHELYKCIASNDDITGRVIFDPWGNDIVKWYAGVDVILSCSDSESFHYGLADGVLTGCFPVVWRRPGVGQVFDENWVVNDTQAAAHCIAALQEKPIEERARMAKQNRDLIIERYGSENVFSRLDALIFG
ncbi:MAG TPA: hypothetical protein VE175_07015 [Woeseiaceae bacterium]|nr:hypothetical protein [Woeseiaceae bacterium]